MSDVVPEYLDERWRVMRAHLRLAAAHATAAAEASTIEDVILNLRTASVALMDADFVRHRIEREAAKDRPTEPNGLAGR